MAIAKKASIILLAVLLLFSVFSGCVNKVAADDNAQTSACMQTATNAYDVSKDASTAAAVTTTVKAAETAAATAISTTKAVATTAATAATTQDKSTIPWNEAINHIGETVTIRGPVISTYYASGSTGKPTFLNIGTDRSDKDSFTVIIFEDYRTNFSPAPEVLYAYKTIRVTGTIKIYNGAAEMEVRTPSQIQIG